MEIDSLKILLNDIKVKFENIKQALMLDSKKEKLKFSHFDIISRNLAFDDK